MDSVWTDFRFNRAYIAAIFAFIGIGLMVMGILNNTESSENGITSINRGALRNNPPLNFNGLVIYANLTAIDVHNQFTTLRFDFWPFGRYLEPQDTLKRSPAFPINITIESKTSQFRSGHVMSSIDYALPFSSGSITLYPSDYYSANFYIMGQAFGNRTRIPLSISLKNNLDGWKSNLQLTDMSMGNYEIVMCSIALHRSANQQFFSYFLSLTMWVISILVLTLAVTIAWFQRKIDSPMIVMSCSMLFALPAIRNILPGGPPIGVNSDGNS